MKSVLSDRTILVTGGAGFIGSHLVEALVAENDVRVLDNFETGDPNTVPDEATLLEGDVCDQETVRDACSGVDVVFHQAAIVSVERSVRNPRETDRTNLSGTLEILEAARTERTRVVLASSAAVYGHPTELPVCEKTRLVPTSPYGVQKLAVDRYARVYAELYDLPIVPLRYFNVYGPRQRGPYSGVISTFLRQARANEPITIEGDGMQSRDFVHVDDVVRANLLAATTEEYGMAYNVGTGTRTTVMELAETVRRIVGSDSTIRHCEPREGDVRHSVADVTRARSNLEFTPSIGLETGLRTLVEGDGRGILECEPSESTDR